MITTAAILDGCRRCGTPILVAHSEGIPVRTDATPLTPERELEAILAGLATYDVQALGLPRMPYLGYRNQYRIAGKREWTVVADHQCPPGPHNPPPPQKPVPLIIRIGSPVPDDPQF